MFLSTARRKLLSLVKSGEIVTCPLCGSDNKIYKRRVHSTMARDLIKLYQVGGMERYVYYGEFRTTAGSGDMAKARWFGLLVPEKNDPNVKANSAEGYWKLTEKGKMFVESDVFIDEYVEVYHNKVIARSRGRVDIQDCLGTKFNYSELME